MAMNVKYYKGQLIEYEIYKLVDFYDPILRKPTIPWEFSDQQKTKQIGFSLAETLGKLEGLGLSANQVGLPYRICVLNLGEQIWTMFNPQIINKSAAPSIYQEGCLSYPGLYLKIPRSDKVTVKFQGMDGGWIEQEFAGLTSVCVQHELDHLDGIVYTDLISPIKLDIAKRKVKKNLKSVRRITKGHSAPTPAPVEKIESGPKIEILNPVSPENTKKQSPEVFVYNPIA